MFFESSTTYRASFYDFGAILRKNMNFSRLDLGTLSKLDSSVHYVQWILQNEGDTPDRQNAARAGWIIFHRGYEFNQTG